MEGYPKNEAKCPQLLDLIPKDEFLVKRVEERSHGPSEEDIKLDLSLGPPGQDWTIKDSHGNNSGRDADKPLLFLSNFSNMPTMAHGEKRGSMDTVNWKTIGGGWINNNNGNPPKKFQQQTKAAVLQLPSNPQSLSPLAKESLQPCCTRLVDAEKKAFSTVSASTASPNSSQKRPAPTPVVGWPPVRSFRKNLASCSTSKPPLESQKVFQNKGINERSTESCQQGKFVKINMDGVPIGRKVNLHAYGSYEKLSSVVDELFRGLLAAQCETSAGKVQNKKEGEKAITGLLDGSGEYTLAYEDHEGDRMLVGDVPWHMFVSTVKRLRVLRSSEIPKLCLGSKRENVSVVDALK